MPNSIQAQAYSEPYQRFKMQFLATIVNSSRGVLRWSFLRKTFSDTHYFQPFTIYTKSSILDVPLCSEYASGTIISAIGSILMFDWVLDIPQDMNCEKPLKELFLETLQQRLRNNFWQISDENSTEKGFHSCFQQVFAIFTGKHLCRSLFLIKL